MPFRRNSLNQADKKNIHCEFCGKTVFAGCHSYAAQALVVLIAIEHGESQVSEGVLWFKDKYLKERWHCSDMKLWRLRRDGKLHSIQLGGCGPYLTSDAEIARIEAPPEIVKPAPSGATEGSGPRDASASRQSNPTDRRIESIPQAFPNGRAGR